MGKSQLYLIDERKDLEFLDKTQVEYAEGSVYFAQYVRQFCRVRVISSRWTGYCRDKNS